VAADPGPAADDDDDDGGDDGDGGGRMTTTSGPGTPSPRQRLQRWLGVALAAVLAAALLAYGTALAGEYVFDDVHSVSANPSLHDLGNLGRYWTDPSLFSGTGARMYRPVLLTSFALNWALCSDAWSLKLGNLLLHAATAALLFGWLWRLSRQRVAATVAAVLFAVHPLASEAINLTSARSELLSLCGLLAGLLAHLAYVRRTATGGAVGLTVVAAVIACGSKETGVVLPALCALQAWLVLPARQPWSTWRRQLLGLLPMVAVVIGYLLVRKVLLGQVAVPLLARDGGDPLSGHGRTLSMQLATMGTLLPEVLLQLVAPFRLSLDPPVVYRDRWLDPTVVLGWASVLAVAVVLAWRGPGQRLRRMGLGVALATALPWIVIPLNVPLAEHRLYGVLAGAATAGLGVWFALRQYFAAHAWSWPGRWRPALRAAGVVVGLLAGLQSAQRSWLYREERLLWQAELAHQPHSFRGWWGLGLSSIRVGDVATAIPALSRAHGLYPRHHDALRHYVEQLVGRSPTAAQPALALEMAARLVAAGPEDPWVRTLDARAHLLAGEALGRPELLVAAEALALSCLSIAAPKGFVYQLAADARRLLGDLEGALAHLDASIARGLAPVFVRLARVDLLRQLGRADEARRELLRAQAEAPFDPRVMRAMQQPAMPGR
jgi:tetratricopeptide (TPR) repeat protein